MYDSSPTSAAVSANDTAQGPSPHRMVKFVGSDSAGLPLKRKQVSQACLSCRRRKKRCTHQDDMPADGGGDAPDASGHGGPNPASPMRRRPFSPSGPGGVAHPPPRPPRPPPSQVPTPPTTSSSSSSSSRNSRSGDGDGDSHGGGGGVQEKQPSRFVGDLSPEQFLIEATSPHSSRDLSVRGGVGVWQGKRSAAAAAHAAVGRSAGGGGGGGAVEDDHRGARDGLARHDDDADSNLRRRLGQGPSGLLRNILVAHVRTHCLPCVPPAPEWAALRALYRQKVDPLFPALSRQVARTTAAAAASPADGSASSVADIVVRQVVSLAAAADPEATGYLRLAAGGPLLDRDEFRAHLAAAITATLDAGVLADRLLAVRVLVVLSLFVQPTAPEDADLPSGLFARATHQFQTLGYHIGAVHNSNSNSSSNTKTSSSTVDDNDYGEIRTLFCCTWALDKLTAAFYGRAVVLHERDVGWDVDACIAAQAPPFRFFLGVVRLLEDVIGLYRPSKKHEDHDPGPRYIDLPISEQMMLAAGATDVASPLLATVEVFYHAVAILSCRPTATSPSTSTAHDAQPQQGSATTTATTTIASSSSSSNLFPPRATNSRRSHAADRILDILTSEFPLGGGGPSPLPQQQGPPQLSYLPILPFAVSLALSVAYRKMRYSAVPMFRARGRRAFAAHTALLQQLGASFWMARSMGAMADQVRREMDKALVAARSSQQDQQQQQQHPVPSSSSSSSVAVVPRGSRSPAGPDFGSGGGGSQGHQDEVGGTVAEPAQPKEAVVGAQVMAPPPVTAATMATATAPLSAMPPDLLAPWPQPTDAAMDVFDHFDPAFDLDAVDAAIEGSLDFGASSNWFDWQQEWGFPQ